MFSPRRLLPPFALLAGLAACTSSPGIFASDAPSPVPDPVNVVSYSSRSDSVSFAPGQTELSGTDLDRLRARLSPADLGREHLVLVAPALPGDGLSEARAGWTVAALRRQGVVAVRSEEPLPAPSRQAVEDGGVLLEIQRASVAPPVCDSYPRALFARVDEAASAKPLGCSTTANLGTMVADPTDLRRGRPTAFADGTREARAVEQYRTGDSKEQGGNPIAEAFAKAFGGMGK